MDQKNSRVDAVFPRDTRGHKRLLTVLLLSLNVLLAPLLEIAAHRPSLIRAAFVARVTGLRSASKD